MAHCVEAFTNRKAHPMIDGFARMGFALVGKYLARAVRDGSDTQAREGMMLASLLWRHLPRSGQHGGRACHSLSARHAAQPAAWPGKVDLFDKNGLRRHQSHKLFREAMGFTCFAVPATQIDAGLPVRWQGFLECHRYRERPRLPARALQKGPPHRARWSDRRQKSAALATRKVVRFKI